MHVNACAVHYGKEEDPKLVLPTSLCSSDEGEWGEGVVEGKVDAC